MPFVCLVFTLLLLPVRGFEVFYPDWLRRREVEAKLSYLGFKKLKTRYVIKRHRNFQILIRGTIHIFIMQRTVWAFWVYEICSIWKPNTHRALYIFSNKIFRETEKRVLLFSAMCSLLTSKKVKEDIYCIILNFKNLKWQNVAILSFGMINKNIRFLLINWGRNQDVKFRIFQLRRAPPGVDTTTRLLLFGHISPRSLFQTNFPRGIAC